jgi:S-adenosylmethionine hydrolase
MAPRFDTITFLSDYGTGDEFVGVVHSVIRSIAPHVAVIDLTHEIPAYDVRAGSLTLGRAAQYLCAGVVLAVVDPGVGTQRRGVAIEVGDGQSYLVGPDNGLLASAVAMSGGATAAVELANPEYQLPAPGPTFAGRDVFAPAAAHLCNGVPLRELGPAVDPVTLLPGLLPLTREDGDAVVAEVLWVDRFGNCQLNVDPDALFAAGTRPGGRVEVRLSDGARAARWVHTYADARPSELVVLVDSYGLLSLAFDRESAAAALGLRAGSPVTVVPEPGAPFGQGAGPPARIPLRAPGGSAP